MIAKETYAIEHVNVLREKYKKDPFLLERVLFAFGLLEAIARVGMPFIFKGGSSSYSVKHGKDIRLLIKGENNETDPMDCYRIVRFKTSKNERRIQWIEFESSLIGSKETKNAGYVQFGGHKYGERSYLLTIPASEIEKGEYGIFYMSIITASSIPVGTFSVQ